MSIITLFVFATISHYISQYDCKEKAPSLFVDFWLRTHDERNSAIFCLFVWYISFKHWYLQIISKRYNRKHVISLLYWFPHCKHWCRNQDWYTYQLNWFDWLVFGGVVCLPVILTFFLFDLFLWARPTNYLAGNTVGEVRVYHHSTVIARVWGGAIPPHRQKNNQKSVLFLFVLWLSHHQGWKRGTLEVFWSS